MTVDRDSRFETEFKSAIVRRPARNLGDGITTSSLGAPEYDRACIQFEAYTAALEDAGLSVTVLDALEDFPDAHFVEDAAVMLPGAALLCRSGAAARRAEIDAMAPVLARFGDVLRVEAPGTLDGGDVLQVGGRFLIGISERTNEEGARQLGAALAARGFTWRAVPVGAGLHFKSSVNHVGGGVLLVGEAFAGHEALADSRCIVVDRAEEYACNCLLINDRLLVPDGYPETRRKLEELGRPLVILDTSEFRKMDGGLTCLSLRF